MAGVKKYNIIDKLFEEAFDKYAKRGHDINWDSILEYMQATNKSNYNITMDDLRDATRRTRRKDLHYGKKILPTDKNTRPKSVEDLGFLPKQGQAYKLFDMDGHDKAKMFSGNIFFDNVYLDEFNQAIFNFIDEAGVPFQIMGDSTRQIDLYANKSNQVRNLDEIKRYQQNLFDIEDHLDYMTKELGLEQQSAYFDYNIKPLYEQVKQYETKYNVNPNKQMQEIHDKYRRQIKKNKLYDKEFKANNKETNKFQRGNVIVDENGNRFVIENFYEADKSLGNYTDYYGAYDKNGRAVNLIPDRISNYTLSDDVADVDLLEKFYSSRTDIDKWMNQIDKVAHGMNVEPSNDYFEKYSNYKKELEYMEKELEGKYDFENDSDITALHEKMKKFEDRYSSHFGDTVEEAIENTAETVIKNTTGEVLEETAEKIIKETTGINTELDGFNKKRTPKKLKKGTGKYKGKTKGELYDRLDNSRYWAVDFPGSNGDFAVHGPNGTKRLEKESIDQQRRRRKYEQTRQKYEKKQQQRQEQKQKDFVDNTMHIDDEIDLDELNKQWYESKQREFDQKQKEIDDYFENNADINPEDVLKDDYEPDANKYTDDINNLDKNFEQGKDFDINKGVDEALDAANKTVEATREGGSISKYLDEFKNMGFLDKITTVGNVAAAVSDYKDARREGHGVVSSALRAGTQFALGEAMGLYYPLFLLAKEAPGLIVKGTEMLYKENRKMNSAANNQIFGDAQFQDTQQLATMRQSGMEMAKMAQYNLQQTLMGQEATYFHR